MTPIWLRLFAIPLGVFLILWLPYEDPHTGFALGLAALCCLWVAVFYLQPVRGTAGQVIGRHGLGGCLAGLAVVPSALLLMAIKTGLHAHPVADFSADQIINLLQRSPIWVSAGLLLGLGSGLWRQLHRTG